MVAWAFPAGHPERDMIVGAGNGGQRVVILPSLSAVVVTTAGLYGDMASGLTVLTTLNEFVFPAAVERRPAQCCREDRHGVQKMLIWLLARDAAAVASNARAADVLGTVARLCRPRVRGRRP